MKLNFDNRFARELPADPQRGSERRQINNACFSYVDPTSTSQPELVAYSRETAALIGLSEDACLSASFAEIFNGNRLVEGMTPYATCYGGHQFGNWAGQLGDGRAINLGEVLAPDGNHYTLQLKGAGPTPYSRSADGLAVLRSSVREFLCSEAMHHLGVPTTRALSITRTGDQVLRDMLYDGHPDYEPGAVVCRVAPSFTRFGHFEILAARQEHELLSQFITFSLRNEFPELPTTADTRDNILSWFAEICERTATMVAHWARVGFVHGVMNTDNMSILGLTIDYGPYGWLDDYDPNWTPNTTDAGSRRYRFSQQAPIAQWNLMRLANAIFPLINDAQPLEDLLTNFEESYLKKWHAMMASKLGIKHPHARDAELFDELERVLQLTETDMTRFYRGLDDLKQMKQNELPAPLQGAYYTPEQLTGPVKAQILAWLTRYQGRLAEDAQHPAAVRELMNQTNPKYVLRNYLAQLAIDDAHAGDNSLINELLDTLRKPYDEQPEREHFAALRPDWARTRVGCSQLSCSS